MLQFVALGSFVNLCDEDVETSHSRVAVAREVEVAIGSEGREHLVARRVDGVAQVLNATECSSYESDSPNVKSTLSTRHIRTEIEPLAIGRDGGVGVAGECVVGDFHFRRFPPCGVRAVGLHDLRIARIAGVGNTLGEIHLATIRAERAGSFVEVGVQSSADGFGAAPLAFVVFLGDEDVGRFCACNTA